MDQDGRASGDAYVEFASSQDVDEALKKHKEKMGHRWGWFAQLKEKHREHYLVTLVVLVNSVPIGKIILKFIFIFLN